MLCLVAWDSSEVEAGAGSGSHAGAELKLKRSISEAEVVDSELASYILIKNVHKAESSVELFLLPVKDEFWTNSLHSRCVVEEVEEKFAEFNVLVIDGFVSESNEEFFWGFYNNTEVVLLQFLGVWVHNSVETNDYWGLHFVGQVAFEE